MKALRLLSAAMSLGWQGALYQEGSHACNHEVIRDGRQGNQW